MPMLLVAFTLTAIIWLTQSLRFMDLIVNRGLDFATFLYVSSLLIPSLIGVILPITIFTAVIYTYNKLTLDSEMIVLKNAGLSRMQLAKPALMVAGGVTLFAYMVSLYISPAAYRELKDMQAFIRDNYASVLLQEGVFNTPLPGLTVYIQDRHDDGMLKGILVHDGRVEGSPVTMMAKEGRLIQTSTGPRFELLSGNRQEINYQEGQLSLLYFEHYTLDLSMYINKTQGRWREPQERYIHELLMPEKERPEMANKLRAEAHQRLTWPLYNLVLSLLGIVAMISGQFNRRGQWKRILVVTVIGTFIMVLAVGIYNIAASTPWLMMMLYVFPLLLLLLEVAILISDSKNAQIFSFFLPRKTVFEAPKTE